MDTIYLITRVDFDDLENHNPRVYRKEGFAASRVAADKFVQEQDLKSKHHQGYDRVMYPFWKIEPIQKVG